LLNGPGGLGLHNAGAVCYSGILRSLDMTHECNSYCKNSEHCDMVFTGDTDLHIAAPRIAEILSKDHGVKVVKVQPALGPANVESTKVDSMGRGGWWLTWWTAPALGKVAENC
jgi:hypothetical protein